MEAIERFNKYIFIFLVLISGLLLFWQLGSTTLTNWDEAWYADISRNMYSSGDYMTPVWNKGVFFDKPPLYFWLTVTAYKIFGVSEFSARFVSSLSALLACIVLYFLANLLFNRRVALLAFIILSSTIAFLYRSRTGNLDALLTFLILLSIYSFYKGLLGNKKWFLIMGLSVALGFLTKGFAAFFFPVIAFLYLLLTKNSKVIKSKYLLLGIFIPFIITFFWLGLNFNLHKSEFILGFFANQGGKVSTTLYFWQNFSFEYLNYLKSGLKLWFVLFIPSLVYISYKWRTGNLCILTIYFFLFLFILFFSENKSNWFLMPLYPFIALMISFTIEKIKFKFTFNSFYIVLFTLIFIAIYQNLKYQKEYIVPDVSINEKNVALAAKNLTGVNDEIYLTNYYYPTIVFYSQRRTFAVYSEHNRNPWWIKNIVEWDKILKNNNIIIITSEQELTELREKFSQYKFEIKYKSGDKILVEKL